MTETQPIIVERGEIATITLNRPDKFNAMTDAMGDAFAEAVRQVNADSAVRVVVVRGAGRAFCAGGDFDLIGGNARTDPEQNRRNMLAFYGKFLSALRIEAPTVAVLHGATIGAGLCLALACDVRFAADEAKLGANFVRVGLHPGMGCSLLLPALAGRAIASQLLLSGQLIKGQRAAQLGIVNQSVPRSDLPSLVDTEVAELLRAAPIAARQTKATLIAPVLRELDAALAREAQCQAIDFTTRDLDEAVNAFRAGRAPKFSGE